LSGDIVLLVAVFLACSVEAVEALTIVLAVGITRGWRSALQGVGAGLAVLSVVVVVLGPAVAQIPLDLLRLLVGGLLLTFGLGWLRKAILRASGAKDLHDEVAIYAREVAAARSGAMDRKPLVGDWYAFTLSFKGVVLEGLEVVFIVLTFGANQGRVGLASVAAVAAVAAVTVAGVAARNPLSKVPENTLKFAVGVLITSFGLFWAVEGAGCTWPGQDAALLVIIPAVLGWSICMVVGLRRAADSRVLTEGDRR
jgi:uncharacterized membrane protein